MNYHEPPKIVLFGMLSRHPVAGMVWLTMQHVVGLNRLGYDVYYVEAHGANPSTFMEGKRDGAAKASAFIAGVMKYFDMADKWVFQSLHSDDRCFGLSQTQLGALYDSAALLINLHGATPPLPEHSATGRLVYLGTDPVAMEIALHEDVQAAVDFLEPHSAFFTWGENYGNPDCRVPVSERFHFKPTRQPVLLDMWWSHDNGMTDRLTTVGSWRQLWREVKFQGEIYHWSKHFEFLKFIDLPTRTAQPFELALANCDAKDQELLELKGWHVRDALSLSEELDDYRDYIARSRGEFTVAKDQNVRLRSGWFSDRSATYLAAGRPVITQETGFSNVLPTGEGLFGFSTMEDILAAVDALNADYERHSHAAYAVAREYFSYDKVLPAMLAEVGL